MAFKVETTRELFEKNILEEKVSCVGLFLKIYPEHLKRYPEPLHVPVSSFVGVPHPLGLDHAHIKETVKNRKGFC